MIRHSRRADLKRLRLSGITFEIQQALARRRNTDGHSAVDLCVVLIAALTVACSSPSAPATTPHAPPTPPPFHPRRIAASPVSPTDQAVPTAVVGTATPSGPPAPSAIDQAVRLSGNGPLAAGSYYLDNRYYTNASRLTITVPAGWTTEEYGELYKDRDGPGEVKFITWVLTHVFSDACEWGTLVDVGTTVDELVTALTEQEGRNASAPTSVTVGGFPPSGSNSRSPLTLTQRLARTAFFATGQLQVPT